ncbi:hypothetical protein AGR1B_Cc10438 [Agrobacterium fabacearum S56]|nr:hypothetical protein AGR1B_Cc10438 [Agrobacterium fabacearum S56]
MPPVSGIAREVPALRRTHLLFPCRFMPFRLLSIAAVSLTVGRGVFTISRPHCSLTHRFMRAPSP